MWSSLWYIDKGINGSILVNEIDIEMSEINVEINDNLDLEIQDNIEISIDNTIEVDICG